MFVRWKKSSGSAVCSMSSNDLQRLMIPGAPGGEKARRGRAREQGRGAGDIIRDGRENKLGGGEAEMRGEQVTNVTG